MKMRVQYHLPINNMHMMEQTYGGKVQNKNKRQACFEESRYKFAIFSFPVQKNAMYNELQR
jgi:hypothetical protein